MDQSLTYKREQSLARIAKRGYPELRLSVLAISEGAFDAAIKNERHMLQHIA